MKQIMQRVALGALVAATLSLAGGMAARADDMKVTMMVGGIDKQIYLPYQLAQNLGFFKKHGIDIELSTENDAVGAEDAMISGQVDMAGAWYNHTIDFQLHGKKVIDIVQLSGAPGEREMCAKDSNIKSPADWAGKTVGVTDIGSGTDALTLYLAAHSGLTSDKFSRVGVGAGATLIAGLIHGEIVCGMTTQPTVSAIEKKGIGYSAFDLATTEGVKKWLGGTWPTASIIVRADWVEKHPEETQRVVSAMVETMHWINTHSAADIADNLPKDFVSNQLTSRQDYIDALNKDKGQFLPDGMMPADGPATVLEVLKKAGKVKGPVDLASTYTNDYVIKANKELGFTK
ncbi:ABC transporter substrate-binding protein [Labrys miyagiensis]|uniref:ABC transporter substrate-binding protein n=1 Tax=Labrys miyagiensis TaxID=346912 RepID=A0ABQ6CE03_9HYPH|nr:ABC transporter substrate-binding protein [Labrys miyagiensis]GLS17888.1 ABC transporter substrate-binding protein [Labrys miyagiensis]